MIVSTIAAEPFAVETIKAIVGNSISAHPYAAASMETIRRPPG